MTDPRLPDSSQESKSIMAEGRDLSPLLATALCLWSLLYMVPHLYWALGGTLGFSMLKPSAVLAPEWRFANLVAAVMLTLAGLLGFGLVYFGRYRIVRISLLTATLVGASVSAAHGLYGIVFRILNVVGVIDIDGRPFELETHGWVLWDLFVIEPWFLIEGVLLGAVGWATLSQPAARRKWALTVGSGVVLVTLAGLLGVRVG